MNGKLPSSFALNFSPFPTPDSPTSHDTNFPTLVASFIHSFPPVIHSLFGTSLSLQCCSRPSFRCQRSFSSDIQNPYPFPKEPVPPTPTPAPFSVTAHPRSRTGTSSNSNLPQRKIKS